MRVPLVSSEASCAGHAPENTLAGIELALGFGADAIEIDVQCTADGVTVLLHDETVDRTTDGSGSVHEMTLADVRRLDAGARQFAPRFLGQRIPTLAEVLDLTRGKALLQIEVKQKGIEAAVAVVVRDASAVADCEVHSFYPSVVRRMREVEPRMACALLTGGGRLDDWSEFCSFALSLNAQSISVYHPIVTPERVRQAQRRGLTCMVWTVDEEPEVGAMLAAGVDSINTNYPDRARRIVDACAIGGSSPTP